MSSVSYLTLCITPCPLYHILPSVSYLSYLALYVITYPLYHILPSVSYIALCIIPGPLSYLPFCIISCPLYYILPYIHTYIYIYNMTYSLYHTLPSIIPSLVYPVLCITSCPIYIHTYIYNMTYSLYHTLPCASLAGRPLYLINSDSVQHTVCDGGQSMMTNSPILPPLFAVFDVLIVIQLPTHGVTSTLPTPRRYPRYPHYLRLSVIPGYPSHYPRYPRYQCSGPQDFEIWFLVELILTDNQRLPTCSSPRSKALLITEWRTQCSKWDLSW